MNLWDTTRQDIARTTFCIPFAPFPAEISGTHEKKTGESSLRGVDESPVGAWANAEKKYWLGGGAGISGALRIKES